MLTVLAPDGVPEVRAGDDLAALLLAVADVQDGDIVVVTSKVVSKAAPASEGRVREAGRDDVLAEETGRVVARRGETVVVRHRLGLTLAAAGIDASNVERGRVVLLPLDPDASARRLRADLRDRTGANVGVLVTDTLGRAWRTGQTDVAIGAAGVRVLETYAGRVDPHGNPLSVTEPAVADELAGAAELAKGKLGGRPFAIVRGRADLVLPPDDDGPGAAALVRPEGADLFGYGAREAVVQAARGESAAPFGSAVPPGELADALQRAKVGQVRLDGDDIVVTGGSPAVVALVAFAHGWSEPAVEAAENESAIRLRFHGFTP
jgi:coenzyme F420-0:L-glutamate ligase/coenzyme F420-1:gamma-L-glutamate ligase